VWTIGLGTVLGLIIGAGALLSIQGVTGVAACLVTLGFTVWRERDAEPVLVRLYTEPEPRKGDQSGPEPRFIEPLAMVELPGGTFLMGSPDSDSEALSDEKPQYKVTVSAFCISRYPTTRRLYRDIVGSSPQEWSREKNDYLLPANSVNWFEAARFCNATPTVGKGVRLTDKATSINLRRYRPKIRRLSPPFSSLLSS
jgi:hypothetical protein